MPGLRSLLCHCDILPKLLFNRLIFRVSKNVSKFHTLKVKEINRETPEAVSVGFDVPVDLKEDYTYKQGQYLTLRFIIGGEEIRRSYSICSSPFEKDKLEVAIKKVKGGKVSGYIND